jgi:hypothetical protein
MGTSMVYNSTRNAGSTRKVNYKKLVKKVYPFAVCFEPETVPATLIDAYFIYHFDPALGEAGRFVSLGPRCNSAKSAWEVTWRLISTQMLKTLES